MAGVRHICLIARSISVMHPRAGVGRWPVRMMLAVAGDGSGPIVGEEDMPSRVMKGKYYLKGDEKGLTEGAHMPLYFLNEVPNLRTALWLLKAQRIVDPVWLSPHN